MNKFNRKQEKNAMDQHAVYQIILKKKNKLSAEDEAHNNVDSEIDEDGLYEIDNMSLHEKK